MKVKFGIFTDLHSQYIHDSISRFETFINDCKTQNVDFAIELGDFCPPVKEADTERKQINELISSVKIPFYHSLGNHDMDSCCKADVLCSLSQSKSYFSFDVGKIHFVILDTCFAQKDGEPISYNSGNYKQPDLQNISILPDFELKWLEEDLNHSQYPAIIFSHHSLIQSRASIANTEDFNQVVKNSPCQILMCICGHEHVDRLEIQDKTHYYCLNSASYYWAGSKYEHTTYGSPYEELKPMLRKVFPYSNPLYAIIEIDQNIIKITGRTGQIVGKTPFEVSFKKPGLTDPITASIIDRIIKRQSF